MRPLRLRQYSPQFALRSYAYLWLHALIGRVAAAGAALFGLSMPKIGLFYAVRITLALLSAASEAFLCHAVAMYYGLDIARYLALLLLCSAGMYSAAPAFLPSSFAMMSTTVALACWIWAHAEAPYKTRARQLWAVGIFSVAFGSLFGWPFAAAAGLPMALEMIVLRREWRVLLQHAILAAAVVLVPLVLIDSAHYGRLVVAPWNIVLYNVLGVGGGGGGSTLYGTAPLSYYLMNGLLNFNVGFLLALLAGPLMARWHMHGWRTRLAD